MPDEHTLALRQADQARDNFASISDDLDFIQAQLALLPTRKELARLTLLAMISGAALTGVLLLLLR
jgi:hypothetical protein